jgi:hypothetical protein
VDVAVLGERFRERGVVGEMGKDAKLDLRIVGRQ